MHADNWVRIGALSGVIGLVAIGAAGCAATSSVSGAAPAATAVPSPAETSPAETSLADQLRYLIEEEKLAHDVYTTLGEAWSTPIFDRIASSETSHQAEVETLLVAYGVEDPRIDEVGVFADPDLQRLYDQLVAGGLESYQVAVDAGLTIERTDIAALTAALPSAPEDVAAVLERLLSGSQNHLAAFERQA